MKLKIIMNLRSLQIKLYKAKYSANILSLMGYDITYAGVSRRFHFDLRSILRI